MAIYYEDRGKFVTTIISKDTIAVLVQTTTHQIKGYVHVRPGERLKDGINQDEPFLAITDAVVLDPEGSEVYRSGFLAVNRQHIIWLLPEDQLMDKKSW